MKVSSNTHTTGSHQWFELWLASQGVVVQQKGAERLRERKSVQPGHNADFGRSPKAVFFLFHEELVSSGTTVGAELNRSVRHYINLFKPIKRDINTSYPRALLRSELWDQPGNLTILP